MSVRLQPAIARSKARSASIRHCIAIEHGTEQHFARLLLVLNSQAQCWQVRIMSHTSRTIGSSRRGQRLFAVLQNVCALRRHPLRYDLLERAHESLANLLSSHLVLAMHFTEVVHQLVLHTHQRL